MCGTSSLPVPAVRSNASSELQNGVPLKINLSHSHGTNVESLTSVLDT